LQYKIEWAGLCYKIRKVRNWKRVGLCGKFSTKLGWAGFHKESCTKESKFRTVQFQNSRQRKRNLQNRGIQAQKSGTNSSKDKTNKPITLPCIQLQVVSNNELGRLGRFLMASILAAWCHNPPEHSVFSDSFTGTGQGVPKREGR
jgi:hypothetical protein